MVVIRVICISIFSIAVMFLLTKLMGNKQMSELTMFDYINGITIGSIAAEMSTSEIDEFWKPLTAMIVYAIVVTVISLIVNKSIKARRLFSGKSIVIYDNGNIYKKNLSRAKLDLNEMLTQCRVNGYFNLSEIQTIVFESNGRLSILPKSDYRPVTPNDTKLKVNEASVLTTLVLDGHVLPENLKQSGKDMVWLGKELDKLGFSSVKDVFLALADSSTLYAYSANKKDLKNDVFQ